MLLILFTWNLYSVEYNLTIYMVTLERSVLINERTWMAQ